MTHSRRSILRTASALSALAIGASATATAADCSGVPEWDAGTSYSGDDQVTYEGDLFTAEWWNHGNEPDGSKAVWTLEGSCDGGGNEAPTASFTTDVSTPEPGQSVGFDASGSSDPDGSIASYSWEFGDGSTATGQTASLSYGSSGDYTVTLTVTDDGGATDSASTTVSVSSGTTNEAPNASFTVSPSSPTAGESVTFDAADSSDPDGSISSYEWEFGDGSTGSGQSASHAFTSTGDYTVTLTVTDDDGATDSNATTVTVQENGDGGDKADCSGVAAYDASATYSGGDQVLHDNALWTAEWWTSGTEPAESANVWTLEGACNQGPTAAFSTSPASPQPGDSVTFDGGDSSDPDGSIASYAWTIDGTSASGQTPTQTFQSEGFVTVELTVTDDSGVSASTSQEVAIGDPNRLPSAAFSADSFAEPGASVSFDASDSSDPDGSIASYDWDFGDGSSGSGQTVSHAFSTEGTYDVTLTVTDDEGGTATATSTVRVGVSPAQQRVVAYYRQWAQFERGYLPADIPFDKITHAQYAFGRPEQDGTLNLVGDSFGQQVFEAEESWQGPDRGNTFSGYARERDDVTFLLSIGGWGDSEYFSPVAQDPAKRETFAQQCADLVTRTGIDGVDIDWEYPGGGGCTSDSPVCDIDNVSQPGDQERFTDLMQEIRTKLDEAQANNPDRDEPYVLSAAMAADPAKVEGLEHEQLADILDFVSIMTFDYRGIWSPYTGHQAPLDTDPDSPLEAADTWNASYALSYYVDQGWDPHQLNMAVPFYGRSWTDVQPPESGVGTGQDDGLFQPYQGEDADASGDGSFPGPGNSGTSLGGVWEAFDLLGSGRGSSNTLDLDGAGWTTYYDETAASSWSFNADSRLMLTHPTVQSIEAKMSWLGNSPYGGTMLWAIGGDTKDQTLITALDSTLNP